MVNTAADELFFPDAPPETPNDQQRQSALPMRRTMTVARLQERRARPVSRINSHSVRYQSYARSPSIKLENENMTRVKDQALEVRRSMSRTASDRSKAFTVNESRPDSRVSTTSHTSLGSFTTRLSKRKLQKRRKSRASCISHNEGELSKMLSRKGTVSSMTSKFSTASSTGSSTGSRLGKSSNQRNTIFPWSRGPKGENMEQLIDTGFFDRAELPKKRLTRLPVLDDRVKKRRSYRPSSMVKTPTSFYIPGGWPQSPSSKNERKSWKTASFHARMWGDLATLEEGDDVSVDTGQSSFPVELAEPANVEAGFRYFGDLATLEEDDEVDFVRKQIENLDDQEATMVMLPGSIQSEGCSKGDNHFQQPQDSNLNSFESMEHPMPSNVQIEELGKEPQKENSNAEVMKGSEVVKPKEFTTVDGVSQQTRATVTPMRSKKYTTSRELHPPNLPRTSPLVLYPASTTDENQHTTLKLDNIDHISVLKPREDAWQKPIYKHGPVRLDQPFAGLLAGGHNSVFGLAHWQDLDDSKIHHWNTKNMLADDILDFFQSFLPAKKKYWEEVQPLQNEANTSQQAEQVASQRVERDLQLDLKQHRVLETGPAKSSIARSSSVKPKRLKIRPPGLVSLMFKRNLF